MSRNSIFNRKLLGQVQSIAAPQNVNNGSLERMGRDLTAISQSMENKALNIYMNDVSAAAQQGTFEIFNRNRDKPEELNNELISYNNSLLKDAPIQVKSLLARNLEATRVNKVNQAQQSRNQQLLIQERASISKNEAEVTRNLIDSVDILFSNNDNLTEEEIALKQKLALDQFGAGSEILQNAWTSTDSLGKTIFSPYEVERKDKSLKQTIFKSAALSYFKNGKNKIKAYQDWVDNKINIQLPDGEINISKAMSPEIKEYTDNQLKRELNEYLSLQRQQQKEVDQYSDNYLRMKDVELAMQGKITFNPKSKDDQKSLDVYWSNVQSKLIEAGVPNEQILNASLGVVEKTGLIPSAISNTLTGNILNGSDEQRANYSQYVLNAADYNPDILNTLDKDAANMAVMIGNNIRAGVDPENAVKWANDYNSLAKKQTLSQRDKQWSSIIKSEGFSESLEDLEDDLKPFFFFMPSAEIPENLINDYNTLSRQFYVNDGLDEKSASQRAKKVVLSTWGETAIGNRYMRYAPETIYRDKDGWIGQQFEQEFAENKDDYLLEIDYSQIKNNKYEYFVFKRNEYGGLEMILDESGAPKKFFPSLKKFTDNYMQKEISEATKRYKNSRAERKILEDLNRIKFSQ